MMNSDSVEEGRCETVIVACHWDPAALVVLVAPVALLELDHQFVPVGEDQD